MVSTWLHQNHPRRILLHSGKLSPSETSFRPQLARSFATSAAAAASNNDDDNNDNAKLIRLSKLVSTTSSLGLSRNAAERLIREGRVTIAGEPVTTPHLLVDLETTLGALKVNGKAATAQGLDTNETRVWLAHKLPGELVADSDPHDRPCLMQRLRRGAIGKTRNARLHLKPIGRLDMMTEGLILVTNDGDYARDMELPSNAVHRTYRVRVHGILSEYKVARIQRGMTVEGIKYSPMKVTVDIARGRKQRERSTNKWLQLTSSQGKNRQIRKVLEYLGLTVSRLIRISYGDYQLQDIPPGMALEAPCKPIKQQRRKGPLFPRRRRHLRKKREETASPVRWVRHV